MINLLNGQPSLDLLPTARIASAAQVAFSSKDAAAVMLQYGHEHGNSQYLKNLAHFLSRGYQSEVHVENLCATPGASLTLQHVLTILTRPSKETRFVFCQNPTYHLVFDIFRDAGFRKDQFVGVPDDGKGLDVDFLEAFLQEAFKDQGGDCHYYYSGVLYCVPTHANPSTTILSSERRERLVAVARRYNVLLVCDDVYELLTFSGQTPKRLVAYDLESKGKPVVISNGSFSKILAPGARAGWVEAHPSLVKRIGSCGSFISGGSPCNLSNEIISPMLVSDDPQLSLLDNIESLKKKLQDRLYHGLWEPIKRKLVPLGCSANLPQGGYFLWLRLPPGITGPQLVDIITRHDLKVNVGCGELFATPGTPAGQFSNYVRLCFAHYPVAELQTAIDKLAIAIELSLKS